MLSQHKEPFEGSAFPIGVFYSVNAINPIVPHWHEHLEIIKITSGDCSLNVNNKCYNLLAGDMVFINTSYVHSLHSSNNFNKVSSVSVVFDKNIILPENNYTEEGILYRLFLNSSFDCIIITNDSFQYDIINDFVTLVLNEYDNKNTYYKILIKSYIQIILAKIIRTLEDKLQPTNINLNKKCLISHYEILKPAFDYINDKYTHNITIDILCNKCNLSKYYFCRLFKAMTNMTITEYINNIRISVACTKLVDLKSSILDISHSVGYSNISYFNRTFKKIKGLSPTEFKKFHFKDNII